MARPRTKSEKRHIRLRREHEQADQAILESRERMLQRVKERQELASYDLKVPSSGSLKMSEVILDFAQPLMTLTRSVDQQKKAIALAILAWNLSVSPKRILKKRSKQCEALHPKILNRSETATLS